MSDKNVYTVSFYLDGKLVSRSECAEGERMSVPELNEKRNGYNLMWTHMAKPVCGDTESHGYFVKGDPEDLAWSLDAPLMGYAEGVRDNRGSILSAANAVITMTCEVRANPDSAVFIERLTEHLRAFVDPERNGAPWFDLSCNWPYCNTTAAIALCHETSSIWNTLTDFEREQYDFMMQCYAYVQALGTNDCNDYRTGPGLEGNFGKNWNPNYRLANIPPMIFAARYFGGADKLDSMLLAFDYDKTLEGFKKYGFMRAYEQWTKPVAVVDGKPTRSQKDFMEDGGEAFINTTNERLHYVPGVTGGSGEGVRRRYTYKGSTLDEYGNIIASLLENNFSGGEVISTYGEYPDGSPKAYIADHTKSPVEGMMGMMKELASGDGGNGRDGKDIRSCTGYCTHDFLLIAGMLIVLKELDMYDISAPENSEIYALAWVGMTDYLYKREHGYMSYALGHEKGIKYETADEGYYLFKHWWQSNYASKKPNNI